MDLELTGKTALITGASKGIGRAIAERLAREGCNVVLAARDRENLDAAASEIRAVSNIQVTSHRADLSTIGDQDSLARDYADADILINNAGSNPPGEIDEISDEVWRSSWDLKMFGYINMTRHFFKHMKARRSGVIINVVGNSGERMQSSYILGSTGNIGLMGLTRALGGRSPDFNVRVVAVNPGLIGTDRAYTMLRGYSQSTLGTPERWEEMLERMDLPFGRMGRVEEVADTVVFLASPRASYISGTVVTIDGGAANRH
ncbi:MAG: short-chain dehydrogenase/reductase [Hyphomicrobiaceae bacterium]